MESQQTAIHISLPLSTHCKFSSGFLTDNTSYRNKKTKIQIVNIGEETDNFLQPFFFAAHQEFPNLEVGYEKNRPF